MVETVPDGLREMPPSAKLVFVTLRYEGALTQTELAESSLLPARTVRYALDALREAGIVEERLYIQDARKRLYVLTVDDERSETPEKRRVTH